MQRVLKLLVSLGAAFGLYSFGWQICRAIYYAIKSIFGI